MTPTNLDGMQVELPPSFLASPAWFRGDARWLAALPQAVGVQCAAWRLRIVGELAHGSHALAVPVERDGEAFVLRMSPPGPELDVGQALCATESVLAANGDLHSAQVLQGTREPWLTVDPVLLRA